MSRFLFHVHHISLECMLNLLFEFLIASIRHRCAAYAQSCAAAQHGHSSEVGVYSLSRREAVFGRNPERDHCSTTRSRGSAPPPL